MEPRFRIYVKTTKGETFEAFVWCLSAESGVARAKREGPRFGHEIAEAWAIPIQEQAA